jgi:sodium/bile acid cotransporter 7
MQILSDWFLWAILAMVALVSLFPHWAAAVHANTLSDYGIFTIFFLYGVNLSVESLPHGPGGLAAASAGAAFDVCAVSTFVCAVPGGGRAVAAGGSAARLLFSLCALPSTISSSVAMTAIARRQRSGRDLQRHAIEPAWAWW